MGRHDDLKLMSLDGSRVRIEFKYGGEETGILFRTEDDILHGWYQVKCDDGAIIRFRKSHITHIERARRDL